MKPLCERIADKLKNGELITKELNEVAKLVAEIERLTRRNEWYKWVINRSKSDD